MPWTVEPQEPDEIQKELIDLGVRCEKIESDLSKEGAEDEIFTFAESKLGPVTHLINNATFSRENTITNIDTAALDNHYQVNVRAVTLLIKRYLSGYQIKQGGIVNITSGQSLGQMNSEIAYAMTKGAIETLTRTIYSELAAKGITINAVNPGPNDTGWMNEELTAELLKRFPMGRIGQPTDLAYLWLSCVVKKPLGLPVR